jgi:hypothetical protein
MIGINGQKVVCVGEWDRRHVLVDGTFVPGNKDKSRNTHNNETYASRQYRRSF